VKNERCEMDVRQMTSSCGFGCWACMIYKDNITDEMANQLGGMLNMDPKDVPCEGCRSEKGCSVEKGLSGGKGCATKQCVTAKGLHNCSECDEFPCENLMPAAENANTFPHNTKLYNLTRIKLLGIDEWAKEAATIQKKYFKGKFVYGQGPALDE